MNDQQVASVRVESVRAVPQDTITVIIDMNQTYEVTATGDGASLEEVIKTAVEQLRLDEQIIGDDGQLLRNVFVGSEKVSNLDYRVGVGSTVIVDERKSNG